MPKVKPNPMARLRIAVKLEIVLTAKKQSVPKKGIEKFLTAEYAALSENPKAYIKKLLVEDWPKYGNKELLEKSLAEIVPWLHASPPEPVKTLCLCYPYLKDFELRPGYRTIYTAIASSMRQYEIEIALKFPKLDMYDPEEYEDDDMMYFIDRQLEKPD